MILLMFHFLFFAQTFNKNSVSMIEFMIIILQSFNCNQQSDNVKQRIIRANVNVTRFLAVVLDCQIHLRVFDCLSTCVQPRPDTHTETRSPVILHLANHISGIRVGNANQIDVVPCEKTAIVTKLSVIRLFKYIS